MNHKMLCTVVLPLVVAACGKPSAAPEQPKAGATANMAMPSELTLASGVGTITAIDQATSNVTIDHGPVTELKWPAMKMGFSGTPAMLSGLAVGNKVAFSFKWDGKVGRLVKINRE